MTSTERISQDRQTSRLEELRQRIAEGRNSGWLTEAQAAQAIASYEQIAKEGRL